MNAAKLTAFIIDDNPSDIELLRQLIGEARGGDIEPVGFTDPQAAQAEWERRKPDLAFIDYALGKESGLDVLAALRAAGRDLPVIILTGQGNERVAVDAMKAGATDYIAKEGLDASILERSIGHAMGCHQMEVELQRARLLEQHHAYYDGLTNLPNRTLLLDRLQQAVARRRRYPCPAALLFLDLDRFKPINDTLGHAAGDLVLQSVARRLTGCVRETDTVSRLGGDEFAILLSRTAHKHDAATVARTILNALAMPFVVDSHELLLTASIGIALCPDDGEDPETLVRNADAAMYRAKEHRGGSYQFYQPAMNAHALERLRLEKDLRQALFREEMRAYYQPQVDARTGKITGLEALLRWRHRELGLLLPADFIPLAEETGLIVPLGEWMLHTACAQGKAWLDAGVGLQRIAVNLSARQFRQGDLLGAVSKALRDTGLNPRRLALEITESRAMHEAPQTVAVLHELKAMGIQLAMDDFGTGYSSLSSLRQFPIDMLKIDMSFVQGIASAPENAAITRAIIAMAHSLEVKAIAEGVESSEQDRFLRSLDCDEEQGYLFGRPLPAHRTTGLLGITRFWQMQGEIVWVK